MNKEIATGITNYNKIIANWNSYYRTPATDDRNLFSFTFRAFCSILFFLEKAL